MGFKSNIQKTSFNFTLKTEKPMNINHYLGKWV